MLCKRQGRKAKKGRREPRLPECRAGSPGPAACRARCSGPPGGAGGCAAPPWYHAKPCLTPRELRATPERRRLVSANPTREAKTLPRGVPRRGCAARQRELIPPPSSPLRWAPRTSGTQQPQTWHPAVPRGTLAGPDAPHTGTATREHAATGHTYAHTPEITEQKYLDGKHQGYAFMLRKIAEKGFICSVVRYLQKKHCFSQLRYHG